MADERCWMLTLLIGSTGWQACDIPLQRTAISLYVMVVGDGGMVENEEARKESYIFRLPPQSQAGTG